MTVQTPAGEVVLRTRVATTQAEASERTVEIRFEEPGLITRVLHAVATPSMVYFLLVLGLAAIAFELTQPGFGFAGFSGVALRGIGRLRADGGDPLLAGVRAAARGDRTADGRRATPEPVVAHMGGAGRVRRRIGADVERTSIPRSASARG